MTKNGDGGNKLKGDGNDKTMISPSSPLFLHPSDSPSLSLTQTIFNGDNYELWADAVKNGLDAKNKLAFVEGTVKQPESSSHDEESIESVAWRQCNAMVKAWLRNVIDIKLHPSIAFTATVPEIWKELKERYSAGNAPRVHQLKSELNECKQGTRSVVEYYTQLKTIWDELANYSRVPKCTCGAGAALLAEKEEEKVHQFIMGLNTALYGQVRTNLLMEDNLTSLSRAYALVLREERHRAVTRTTEDHEVAMAAKTSGNSATGREKSRTKEQSDTEDNLPPRCTHCKKFYHTEENCWDKHGYQGRGRGRGRRGGRGFGRGGRGHSNSFQVAHAASTTEAETTKQFTAEEMEQLRSLILAKPEGSQKLTGPVYEDGDWTG